MSEPERTCGDCSLCCKIFFVEELEKAEGAWCRHARPGRGCGVYADRPPVCRAFMCQWLLEPSIPDALKPNRSKIILTSWPMDRGRQLVANCDPGEPNAWRREPTHSFLKAQARAQDGQQQVVVVRAGKRVWLVTPQGDMDLGVASGARTFEFGLGPDGKPTAQLVRSKPGPSRDDR